MCILEMIDRYMIQVLYHAEEEAGSGAEFGSSLAAWQQLMARQDAHLEQLEHDLLLHEEPHGTSDPTAPAADGGDGIVDGAATMGSEGPLPSMSVVVDSRALDEAMRGLQAMLLPQGEGAVQQHQEASSPLDDGQAASSLVADTRMMPPGDDEGGGGSIGGPLEAPQSMKAAGSSAASDPASDPRSSPDPAPDAASERRALYEQYAREEQDRLEVKERRRLEAEEEAQTQLLELQVSQSMAF